MLFEALFLIKFSWVLNEIDGEKTSGWFEAQQNAEAMSKSEADTTLDLGTSDESDKQTDSDK